MWTGMMEIPELPMTNAKLSVSVKEESKTAAKLIQAISAGLGKAYEPIATVRQAKADAKSAIIAAEANAKVKEIKERARKRIEYVEIQRQKHIDAVVTQAMAALPNQTESEKPVGEDWTTQFFEHAKDIHDSDMQSLWGRILAGEVSKPGSYSLRTLACLKTMAKEEAELFSRMIRFTWVNSMDTPFIIEGPILRKHWEPETEEQISSMLASSAISHLKNIGLLNNTGTMYEAPALFGQPFRYFEETYVFDPLGETARVKSPSGMISLPRFTSNTYFTQIGMQLLQIAERKSVEGYATAQMGYTSKELHISFHKLTANS